MPPVIKLSKSDLMDFARVMVLANTPLSLFTGMVWCTGMEKLRKCPAENLIEYYDHITARAGRSEITAALAYAVLCAIILQARERPEIQVDASRLLWGERIWEFNKRSTVATGRTVILASPQQPRISSSSSPSTDTQVALYDAHGRPLPWRNPV